MLYNKDEKKLVDKIIKVSNTINKNRINLSANYMIVSSEIAIAIDKVMDEHRQKDLMINRFNKINKLRNKYE